MNFSSSSYAGNNAAHEPDLSLAQNDIASFVLRHHPEFTLADGLANP